MNLISAIFRRVSNWLKKVHSYRRIITLKLLYPNINITGDTYIGKNCIIKCTTHSTLKIVDSQIYNGSVIVADHGGNLLIEGCFIGGSTWVIARKRITIINSLIGEMVSIRDSNHNFNLTSKPIAEQGFTLKEVTIEKNVWLGSKVTVLPGSIIGANTVVGANAVVKGELLSNSVYAGVPVVKIK